MNPIYTIGYAGWTPATLAAQVLSLDAKLIDIRYQPYSRIRHWQEATLRSQFGKRYVLMRCLGNVRYAEGPPIQLANPLAAIEPIHRYLQEGPVVLMCACKDYEHCHRKLAAEFLAEHLVLPTSIVHILPPTDQPAPDSIFALSLWQPWASLVMWGAKKIETRSWATSYRGPLAIHATATFPQEARHLCLTEPFTSTLIKHGVKTLRDLPLGAVLGTVDLIDVRNVVPDLVPDEPERSFGDYTEGRYMWYLDNSQMFETPIPAKGMQKLWNWTPPGN